MTFFQPRSASLWIGVVLTAHLLLVEGFIVHIAVMNEQFFSICRSKRKALTRMPMGARPRNHEEKPSNRVKMTSKTRRRMNSSKSISMSNVTMEPAAPEEVETALKSQQVNEAPPTAASVLRTVWKGMTLPFPALHDLGLQIENESKTVTPSTIGVSIQECIVAISMYLLTGVVAFSLVFEHWSLVDALYFSVTTFTTVGTGDIVPSTAKGRLFACVFGLGGVAFLGIFLATLGSELVSAEVKAQEMVQETSRQRVFDIFDNVKMNGSDVDGDNVERLEYQESLFPLEKPLVDSIFKCTRAASFLLLGGCVMGITEGWEWPTALYYSIVTAGTIGYGDVAPLSPEGRAWAIVFIPLAVACAGEVLGNVASAVIDARQRETYRFLESQDVTLEHLMQMDENRNGQVSKREYVEFMMLEMGLVSQNQLDELHNQFERLDVTNTGYLDVEDLKLMAELRGCTISNVAKSKSLR